MPRSRQESNGRSLRSKLVFGLVVIVGSIVLVAVVGGIIDSLESSRNERRARGILHDVIEDAVGVVETVLIDEGYMLMGEEPSIDGTCMHSGGWFGGYVEGSYLGSAATWRAGPQSEPATAVDEVRSALSQVGFSFATANGHPRKIYLVDSELRTLGLDPELEESFVVGVADLNEEAEPYLVPRLSFILVQPEPDLINIALTSRCAW